MQVQESLESKQVILVTLTILHVSASACNYAIMGPAYGAVSMVLSGQHPTDPNG